MIATIARSDKRAGNEDASLLIDAAVMEFVRRPERFDLVVASNLFGDILTDLAAIIVGSMGLAPSANIDPTHGNPSMFEPVHGSAPDITGQGIANPIGTILSMALMLRYSLALEGEARAVEEAVEGVLAEGYRTRDISGDAGEVVATSEMGEVIAGRV